MEVLARDSLRIVHVEDDHEFAQLCETLLKRAGFEQPIVRCKDGILALHYFSMIEPEYAPDVILLDLHMPHMNEPFVRTSGYTLQELRGKKPGKLLQGPESDHAAIKMLRHAMHSALPCECIITNYRKSGTPYPVHISLSPVFGNSGLEGFLAVERDLSKKEEKLATGDW